MTQEDRNRADARFNKAARAASDARSGKTERDAALKAVTDNMAKLRALRLAREAAEPPRPAPAPKRRAPSRRRQKKKAPHWPIGWRTSKAAVAAPEHGPARDEIEARRRSSPGEPRSSGNVPQPDHVLANDIAAPKAERWPGTGKE